MIGKERILIFAKTYPSPSAKYSETTCVAGITDQGSMRRIFPVPFRLIEENRQFIKLQWIEAKVEKAREDHRLESFKIFVDTISCLETIGPKHEWADRVHWINKIPAFDNFYEKEEKESGRGPTIALVRPKRLIKLQIDKAERPDWTLKEKRILVKHETQGNLFTEEEAQRTINKLQKVPFDFYYNYALDTPMGEKEFSHKIIDWEAGALYWNCVKKHRQDWEKPFREKLEKNLFERDLMFLMGNQHRFQNQWLIISVIYPPKPRPIGESRETLPLFPSP